MFAVCYATMFQTRKSVVKPSPSSAGVQFLSPPGLKVDSIWGIELK